MIKSDQAAQNECLIRFFCLAQLLILLPDQAFVLYFCINSPFYGAGSILIFTKSQEYFLVYLFRSLLPPYPALIVKDNNIF